MNDNQTLLGSIEPEMADRLTASAAEIAQGRSTSSVVGAGLAMASVPIALAALARDAGAQTPSVTAVLNFALKLEIFENEFYKAVLGVSSSAAQNAAFAPVRAMIPAAALPVFQKIQAHEQAHVNFLLQQTGVSNELNLDANSFDFTGGRGSGTGPFAQATLNLQHLLLVTQAAEDTGVRAYKGQAANLMSNPAVLEAALRIHSVEARHAAKIRRLRRQNGAPASVKYSGTVSGGGSGAAGADNVPSPPAAAVAALGLVYAGEDNVTQLGVSTTTLPNMPSSNFSATSAASEAFDEPLTKAQVVAIVQGFFKPDLS
jgi:rubrerythrin